MPLLLQVQSSMCEPPEGLLTSYVLHVSVRRHPRPVKHLATKFCACLTWLNVMFEIRQTVALQASNHALMHVTWMLMSLQPMSQCSHCMVCESSPWSYTKLLCPRNCRTCAPCSPQALRKHACIRLSECACHGQVHLEIAAGLLPVALRTCAGVALAYLRHQAATDYTQPAPPVPIR